MILSKRNLTTMWLLQLHFIVYGVIFIIVENYNKRRKPICTSLEDLSFATAFKIGIFQVLSVIPGTSRSGSTIIGGILVGTSRTVAAEFTFFWQFRLCSERVC